MATTHENVQAETAPADSKLPAWLEAKLFEKVLKESVPGYKNILQFKAYPAMAAGENYATIMLRVEIKVELQAGATHSVSYMLKISHDTELFKEMLKEHNIFAVEQSMYLDVVPEFEQLYRAAGVEVKFCAKCYQLETPESYHNLLLEDLRPFGFKNADRLEGLDMQHTKCALKKLAQWHAASAKRVETKGLYSEILTHGFYQDKNRVVMEQMCNGMIQPLEECMKSYEGHESYLSAVHKLHTKLVDKIFEVSMFDPNEFNVLNHGDCWSNNIMFKYDDLGNIVETYFVDYQIPKYGSPAQELLYFLISSTKYELKLKQFEYFIKFYHDNLVENLTLLEYTKKLPTLKEIHMALYKYGFWGYNVAMGVMGAVLLDPSENASIDNFMGQDEAGYNFKKLMYTNPRYRKHMEIIMPWLLNRGALEC